MSATEPPARSRASISGIAGIQSGAEVVDERGPAEALEAADPFGAEALLRHAAAGRNAIGQEIEVAPVVGKVPKMPVT